MSNNLKTSEWVSPGHPDKVADIISEYILDRMLEKDKNVRYAVECQIKDNYVTLAGELTTKEKIREKDIERWVKDAVEKIGYTKSYQKGFGKACTICGDDIKVAYHIGKQSPNIAQGVDRKGWGDQGIFFGLWNADTEEGFGMDYWLAKSIGTYLYHQALRTAGLGIDIKTQVTWDSDEGKAVQVIIAIPTWESIDIKKVTKDIKYVIKKKYPSTKDAKFIINGTGAYHVHGPIGDSGTTGRKLVVDFYGSGSRIGGGSPWTKDGTKADLTLNLLAREMAKLAYFHWSNEMPNIHRVETEVCCCIGKQDIICVTTAYDKENNQLHKVSDTQTVPTSFLIKRYGLDRPIYADMCMNGLFTGTPLTR